MQSSLALRFVIFSFVDHAHWNVLLRFLFLASSSVLLAAQEASAQMEQPTGLFIEAYPDKQSVAPGDELQLHTSTTANDYSLEIARLGGERVVVFQKSKIPGGGAHPIPENASSNGCNWSVSFRMTVPADWTTGYYQATFRVADSGGKFVGRNRRNLLYCTRL